MSFKFPWTDRELQTALKMVAEGYSQPAIAERLGRPVHGVAAKLREVRLQQQAEKTA